MARTLGKPRPQKRSRVSPAHQEAAARNIQAICELEKAQMLERTLGERMGDLIARVAGHAWFSGVHVVWFTGWIAINRGLFRGIRPFDPYPFQFLTLVVSLEAIFLSLFILMSQNRASRMADQRAHLDLQINLLSELESTKALKMLQALCRKNGLAEGDDRELEQLAKRTEPKDLVSHLQTSLP
jgi:uncharacterized membrane protein